jgi:ribosomal protein L7/L12
MSSEDILDHGRRIAELERKVSELYKRLGQAEPAPGGSGLTFASSEPASVGAAEDPRLLALIDTGQEIDAVKLYRELTGAGLGESKEAVDRIASMRSPAG